MFKRFKLRIRKLATMCETFALKPPPWISVNGIMDWDMVAKRLCKSQNYRTGRYLYSCIFSHDNPGWLPLSQARPPARLLVFGGGWGKQLEELREHYTHITVVEPVDWQRVFLRSRLSTNSGAPCDIVSPESFSNSSANQTAYDTILVRGDFWYGVGLKKLQQFLEEAWEGSQPNGEILVETWGLMRGLFQQHAGLPTPAILSWESFLTGKLSLACQRYRVTGRHWYAGSYLQELKLIHKRVVLPKQQGEQIEHKQAMLSRLSPTVMGLNNYLLVAKTHNKNNPLIGLLGEAKSGKNEYRGYRLTGRGVAMPVPFSANEIIRISLSPTARQRCQQGHDITEKLHKNLPKEVARYIPRSRVAEPKPGIRSFIESRLPGVAGNRQMQITSLQEVMKWMAKLHTDTVQVVSDGDTPEAASLIGRIRQLVDLSERILHNCGNERQWKAWAQVKSTLLAPPWPSGLALCTTHGDLNITNVLFDGNRVSGVIDWETASTHAVPARDVFWLDMYGRIQRQSKTADVYAEHYLQDTTPELVSYYAQQVPAVLADFILHPWCRIYYPLERLQSAWDGYDLRGVIDPKGFAGDWPPMVLALEAYIQRNLTLLP